MEPTEYEIAKAGLLAFHEATRSFGVLLSFDDVQRMFTFTRLRDAVIRTTYDKMASLGVPSGSRFARLSLAYPELSITTLEDIVYRRDRTEHELKDREEEKRILRELQRQTCLSF
jgi:hypothetical protein